MRGACIVFGLFLLAAIPAAADTTPSPSPSSSVAPNPRDSPDVTAQDDPTSTVRTLSVQATYTGATYGPGNFTLTQLISRLATFRVGKSLVRLSVRFQTINGVDHGFGDTQLFYLFQRRVHTGAAFVGVSAQFPTATSPLFGTGKWLIGPAGAYIFTFKPGRKLAGVLLQTAFSVAGAPDRRNQSVITFLPFATFSIGRGWFLRLPEAAWVFDLQRGAGLIPLGLGIARLTKFGEQPILLGFSDEVDVLHANVINAPKHTVRLTVTILLRSAPPT